MFHDGKTAINLCKTPQTAVSVHESHDCIGIRDTGGSVRRLRYVKSEVMNYFDVVRNVHYKKSRRAR